jgi:RNA polymerase sigma-70 factor (ECF subfamily)
LSDFDVNWVDEHGDALYAFALCRVSNPAVAEDLVQETFLAALQSKFDNRSSIRTWLTGILKHKILDYYRKSNRGINALTEQAEDVDSYFSEHGHWRSAIEVWKDKPDELLERKEFVQTLRACIEKLPDNQRAVFIAREIDDISGEKICNKLSISTTNLWVIMYRARDRLRRCLEEKWFARNK